MQIGGILKNKFFCLINQDERGTIVQYCDCRIGTLALRIKMKHN